MNFKVRDLLLYLIYLYLFCIFVGVVLDCKMVVIWFMSWFCCLYICCFDSFVIIEMFI